MKQIRIDLEWSHHRTFLRLGRFQPRWRRRLNRYRCISMGTRWMSSYRRSYYSILRIPAGAGRQRQIRTSIGGRLRPTSITSMGGFGHTCCHRPLVGRMETAANHHEDHGRQSVTALTLVTKVRPQSPELAIIAREMALRLVELSSPPDAQHTPGVCLIFADKLSRVFSPTGKGVLTPDLHPAMATAQVSIYIT